MRRRPFGKEGSKVIGVKFAQYFNLALNFTNHNPILEVIIRVTLLTVLVNSLGKGKRQIALGAIDTEGSNTKERGENSLHC